MIVKSSARLKFVRYNGATFYVEVFESALMGNGSLANSCSAYCGLKTTKQFK